VAVVMKLGTNFNVAELAMPNLIHLLNDQSTLVRSFATEAIGVYCNDTSIIFPTLFRVARDDPDPVIRTQCVKAIWRIQTRLGKVDPNVRPLLEEIFEHDQSHLVRSCAERFLTDEQP
jgi:hypothetical protein